MLFCGTCYVRLWVGDNGIKNVIVEEFKERFETNDGMFVKFIEVLRKTEILD